MKYPLIAAKVARETWAVKPEVFQAIHAAVFHDRTVAMPALEPAHEDDDEPDGYGGGMTRVIPVFGILGKHLDQMEMMCGGCSVDKTGALLSLADKDPDCERIVLAFNSPGGTVTGIPELAAKIRDINTRKPVVGYTDGMCCSAALWLASACDAFFVAPSATVGSVGVFSLILDESRKLEQQGVRVQAISDGKYKLTGAPFKPLTDEEKALLQARVDGIGTQFRAALTASRTIAAEDMEGQSFTGEEAVAKGFAEGLASDLQELFEQIETGDAS